VIVIVNHVGEQPGRRREVLRVLRVSRVPMSIVAIADELDVHPNTVRFHLETLVADGQLEQVQPTRKGPGRPALMFRAVRQMDRGGTRHYQMLAEVLATGLAAEGDPAPKAQAAGREWGRRLESESPVAASAGEAIDRLLEILDELGFAPERRKSGGAGQIGLRHCPFLELAEAQARVICPVHLGLMQGALESWSAPVTVERLEPFVQPDLCLAHLAAAPR
jgi:predicted ArsR family transcriptional regulator